MRHSRTVADLARNSPIQVQQKTDRSGLLPSMPSRNMGIAARFVSGYLIQLATEQTALESTDRGPTVDSAELTCLGRSLLTRSRWIGLDPTSGLLTGEGHIPLVCTPTASQAAPIGGTVEAAGSHFTYSFSVRRLNDARRPSNPLTDEDGNASEVLHRASTRS